MKAHKNVLQKKELGLQVLANAVFLQRKKRLNILKERYIEKCRTAGKRHAGRVNAILQKNLRFYFEIDGTDRFLWDRL